MAQIVERLRLPNRRCKPISRERGVAQKDNRAGVTQTAGVGIISVSIEGAQQWGPHFFEPKVKGESLAGCRIPAFEFLQHSGDGPLYRSVFSIS